jgi:DNA-binding MarR family transcriptional regulator
MAIRKVLAARTRELAARYSDDAVEGSPHVYKDLPGALVRRLHQTVASTLIRQFEAMGSDLTPVQYSVLSGVYTHPSIEQGALADVIRYDRATVGGVVDRLEKKELLQRGLSAHDRRVRVLTLSAAGKALIKKLEPAILGAQEEILAPLDELEREQFRRLLAKLVPS